MRGTKSIPIRSYARDSENMYLNYFPNQGKASIKNNVHNMEFPENAGFNNSFQLFKERVFGDRSNIVNNQGERKLIDRFHPKDSKERDEEILLVLSDCNPVETKPKMTASRGKSMLKDWKDTKPPEPQESIF